MRHPFIFATFLVVAFSAQAHSGQRTISLLSERFLSDHTPYISALREKLREAGFSVDGGGLQQSELGKARSAIAQSKNTLGFALLRHQPQKGNVAATLLLTPGAFASMSEQRAAMHGVIGDIARDEISGDGVLALRLWPYATDAFVSRNRIAKIEDFFNVVAMASDHSSRAVLYALGAKPTTWSRRYPAFEEFSIKSKADAYVLLQPVFLKTMYSEKRWPKLVGGTVIPEFRTWTGVTLVPSDWWYDLSAREQTQLIEVLEKAEESAAQTIKKRSAVFWRLAGETKLKVSTWRAFSNQDVRKAVSKAITNVSGRDAKPILGLLDQVNGLRREKKNPRSNNAPKPEKRGLMEGTVRIFFASNRRHDASEVLLSDQFANSVDEQNKIRCGELIPSRTGHIGRITRPLSMTRGSFVLEGDACISLIGAATKEVGGPLLVYVHGYRNSFKKAIKTGLAFARDVKSKGVVLIWSWPSAAELSSYMVDSERVVVSEPSFRSLVSELSAAIGGARIDFLAHSMGSRFVADLMRDHWIGRPAAVVMAAADVSRRFLSQAVKKAGSASVSLFATESDRALKIAQFLYGEPRAGRAEPIFLMKGMDTINLSAFDTMWSINHRHMFFQPEVVKDLMVLFKGKWSAVERGLIARRSEGSEISYYIILPGDS